MILKYKDYIGHVTHISKGKIFHGEVLGLSGLITFSGHSVEELEKSLKDSIEDYIQWCKEQGTVPEKTYSGNIRVRMEPAIHKKLSLIAAKRNISLNRLINDTLISSFRLEERSDQDASKELDNKYYIKLSLAGQI